MEQLKLNFNTELQTEPFDFTYYPNEGSEQHVYMRREVDKDKQIKTLVIIGSLNFLGKRSGILFRFFTGVKDQRNNMFNDTVLNELNSMSVSELKSFAEKIIENDDKGFYVWNYEHRCHIFKRILDEENFKNSEERSLGNFWSDRKEKYHKIFLDHLAKLPINVL